MARAQNHPVEWSRFLHLINTENYNIEYRQLRQMFYQETKKKRKKHVQLQVCAYSPDGEFEVYNSVREASKQIGVSVHTIAKIIDTGIPVKQGKYQGYEFEYVDKVESEALESDGNIDEND